MRRLFPILTALMVLSAAPVAAQTTVGVNATVENSVRTRSAGETDWRLSIVGGAVRQADAIVTGEDSRLSIALRDQSMLTVGSNASLTVDRFVIDTEADPAGVLVSLVRGAFRFVSGSRGAEPERVAFRTPTATIGIRGTIIEAAVGTEAMALLDGETEAFEGGADPDDAAVIVLVEGEIEIESGGVRRIVREPGQAVAVSGRRISEPFRLSPEAGQRLAGRLPPREPGGGPQGQGQPGRGPEGQPPQGQLPRSQGSPGPLPRGQGSAGSPPQGPSAQGQAPQGQAPQGQTPQGQTPQGQTPQGQTPQGQAPKGEAPQGPRARGRETGGPGDRGGSSRPGSASPGQSSGPGAGSRPG